MSLLSVRDLAVSFRTEAGTLRAVDRVSIELGEGEIVGLVGESGSGKSVTSLAVMGLIPDPPGRIDHGEVLFRGRDLLQLPAKERRRLRGKDISMIFQDPMTSLNPLLTVGRQLGEVLEIHEGLSRREALRRSAAALGEVGIPGPEERLACFPHELSGGIRQRVMIAMALLCRPALVFADEPTTALDVTIQAQILDLLRDLQARHGTSIVLITHDLGVVAGMAERVYVMYAGRIVEKAETARLFREPGHPYTAGLLKSVPTLGRNAEEPLLAIEGNPPDLLQMPPGCAFAPRCTFVVNACRDERPQLHPLDAHDHHSACFEWERVSSAGKAP